MLAEFSICPVGRVSMSGEIAKVAEVLESCGVKYNVGPLGTCLEGTVDQVLTAIRRCHEVVARDHERTITHIKLDDRKNHAHSLTNMVKAVENQLGRRAFGGGIDAEC
jgi:uncharacterized protein (TIGR00106 family)